MSMNEEAIAIGERGPSGDTFSAYSARQRANNPPLTAMYDRNQVDRLGDENPSYMLPTSSDTSGAGMRDLVYRPGEVWQPVAQTIDLGQAAIGFISDGRYEPTWLSGIGRNYDAGMSYGATVARGLLSSNPVTGVGMASYDLTASAIQGDWGGVAEGAGGLVGGFAVGR